MFIIIVKQKKPTLLYFPEPCSLGTESDGNGGCTLCLPGSYLSSTGLSSCISCGSTSTNFITGSTTSNDCVGKFSFYASGFGRGQYLGRWEVHIIPVKFVGDRGHLCFTNTSCLLHVTDFHRSHNRLKY